MRRAAASRMAGSMVVVGVLLGGVTACGAETVKGASADTGAETSVSAPDPKKAQSVLDDALQAHAAGDLGPATKKYEQVLELDPGNKFAYYNLALIDAGAGNYGLAADKYRAALKTDPAYEPALFNLAILRTDTAPEEALGLYQQAVDANPKDASAWMNLGLLLRSMGQPAQGDHAVSRAITLNPQLEDPAASAS
jgi:tetratricopeptide (TPR) repeat protein